MTTRNYIQGFSSKGEKDKSILQKVQMLKYLNRAGANATLPALADHLRSSVPTVTKGINELIDVGLVGEEGKLKTGNGRQPAVYSVKADRFLSIGVEVLLKRIHVSIFNLHLKLVYENANNDFNLENSQDCRNEVIEFIQKSIEASGIKMDDALGVGIAITGRVNSRTGKSYNYFNFDDLALAEYLEDQMNLPAFIENDTRLIGLAEQVAGKFKLMNNTLILNISRGIGMAIMANKKLISGTSGFAGEFGHMQFPANNGRLCICGKQGCIDTEVSGRALEADLVEYLENGSLSAKFSTSDLNIIHYEDIITAANEGDQLSLSLLQNQGEKLGAALGNIINLLNPEMIIISGKYARVGEFFLDSVRSGLHQTALKDPLASCTISNSEISSDSGSIGAAAQVFKRYELL